MRAVSLILSVAGAAGSVTLMRYGGNPPFFLIVLIGAWVISPFLILIWANIVSKRWALPAQATLYYTTFAITLVTLAIYLNRIMSPPRSTGAFVFVAVPPVSWILMVVVARITVSRLRKA